MKTKTLFKLPHLLIIFGLIAFYFSFLITVEKLAVLQDASYVVPCTINPFISCNAVMASAQAEAFGFPNPLLGIAGFAILVTIGFALLAGAKFKTWFWKALNVGNLLATIFIFWLFHAAVYDIRALCLYCIAVWVTMIPIFTYTLRHSLLEGHFKLINSKFSEFLIKWTAPLTFVMYVVIAAAIAYEFWDSWVIMLMT